MFFLLSFLASLPQAQASQIVTYQVEQSSDDCTKYQTSSFSTSLAQVETATESAVKYNDNGLRFNNITFDSSFSFYYVKLIFTAKATQAVALSTMIYGEDNANASTFSTLADFNGRTRTSGIYTVSWTPSGWVAENEYSVDVTVIWLDLLANASWVSGNSMVFFWYYGTGTSSNYKKAYSYDADTEKAVKLEVKYRETFYATFYFNRDYIPYAVSYRDIDSYTGLTTNPSNGTIFPLLEEDALYFETTLNGSYIFQNYTITGNANSTTTDNPYLFTMSENFGNATIWAYSQPITTETQIQENLVLGIAVGATLIAIIGLPFTLLIIKRMKNQYSTDSSTGSEGAEVFFSET